MCVTCTIFHAYPFIFGLCDLCCLVLLALKPGNLNPNLHLLLVFFFHSAMTVSLFCCPFCSISSTLMDMESTASSGRSTPAMLNGHGSGAVVGNGSAPAGGKSLSYTCCWDQCQLHFPSSPDLAEHIRATHVDGQRGGVSVSVSPPS